VLELAPGHILPQRMEAIEFALERAAYQRSSSAIPAPAGYGAEDADQGVPALVPTMWEFIEPALLGGPLESPGGDAAFWGVWGKGTPTEDLVIPPPRVGEVGSRLRRGGAGVPGGAVRRRLETGEGGGGTLSAALGSLALVFFILVVVRIRPVCGGSCKRREEGGAREGNLEPDVSGMMMIASSPVQKPQVEEPWVDVQLSQQ
jgi:hypothetical protein